MDLKIEESVMDYFGPQATATKIVLEFTQKFQKGPSIACSCSFDVYFTLAFVSTYPLEELTPHQTALGTVYIRPEVEKVLGAEPKLTLQKSTACIQLKNETGLLDGNVQIFRETSVQGVTK